MASSSTYSSKPDILLWVSLSFHMPRKLPISSVSVWAFPLVVSPAPCHCLCLVSHHPSFTWSRAHPEVSTPSHIASKFTTLKSKIVESFKKPNPLSHTIKSKLLSLSELEVYFLVKYPAIDLVTFPLFCPVELLWNLLPLHIFFFSTLVLMAQNPLSYQVICHLI